MKFKYKLTFISPENAKNEKMNKFINSEDSDEAGHNYNGSPVLFYAVCHLVYTMAQMAHFSFPYYFTIPNSEF